MNRDWSERGLVRLQPGVGHVVQFGDASKLLVDGALRQFLEVVVHQGIRQGSGATCRDGAFAATRCVKPPCDGATESGQ